MIAKLLMIIAVSLARQAAIFYEASATIETIHRTAT
jgi:hypothetical protein